MVTPAVWLGVAVGLVLLLVGGYVAYLEARVRALEEREPGDERGEASGEPKRFG